MATAYNWHGYLLATEALPAPTCVSQSEVFARPDCDTAIRAAEYQDSPAVLQRKAECLVNLWTAASRPLVYAGAGISTSAGCQDYASRSRNSTVQPAKQALTMAFIHAMKPTPAHRVITAMEKQGLVWGWLQQNHDGLAQKAGFPTDKVNELHGSWLDQQANPIIAMSGSLRTDLFEWMLQMEEQCDFVFAVGTSFSGLNADRCADTCGKRHMKKGQGQGLAILSIQQTPKDNLAAIRIFSNIDTFMLILAEKLALVTRKPILPLPTTVHRYTAPKVARPPTEKEWEAYRSAARSGGAPATVTSKKASKQQEAATVKNAEKKTEPLAANKVFRVGNTHCSEEDGLHKWTMFVSSAEPATIRKVTYMLHPTFKPSEVTVHREVSNNFELCRRGWGTFDVGVHVQFEDGKCMKLKHELSFNGEGDVTDVTVKT